MNKKQKFDDYYQNYYRRYLKEDPKSLRRLSSWFDGWLKFIKKNVDLKKYQDKEVLEIGGGAGIFCRRLQKEGFKEVVCNDVSPQALKLAKKFNPSLKTSCFDIEKTKKKNRHDLIFAFEVLEHLNQPEKAIEILFKLLKPKGLFIGTTPYPFPKAFNDPTHQHVLPPSKWRSFFKRAGFAKIETWPMSFPPLLYRLNKHLNFYLPFYIKNRYFFSTTLIVARKNETSPSTTAGSPDIRREKSPAATGFTRRIPSRLRRPAPPTDPKDRPSGLIHLND